MLLFCSNTLFLSHEPNKPAAKKIISKNFQLFFGSCIVVVVCIVRIALLLRGFLFLFFVLLLFLVHPRQAVLPYHIIVFRCVIWLFFGQSCFLVGRFMTF